MATAKIRIGNGIRFIWSILAGGVEEDFSTCSNVEVELYCARKQAVYTPEFTAEGNRLTIDFPAEAQSTVGVWDARVRYDRPAGELLPAERCTHNTCGALELVECSAEEDNTYSYWTDAEGNFMGILNISITSDFDRMTAADEAVLAQAKEYTNSLATTVGDWHYDPLVVRKKIWTGTEEEYWALGEWADDTLYFTIEDEEPEPEVDLTVTPTSYEFDESGGSTTFHIACSDGLKWSVVATLPEGWEVTPTTGTGAGDILLTVPENGTGNTLRATIVVTGDWETASVVVTQKVSEGKPTITLELNEQILNQGVFEVATVGGVAVLDDLTLEIGYSEEGTTGRRYLYMTAGDTYVRETAPDGVDAARIELINGEMSPLETENAIYVW